jgi:hypothetical protein
MFQEKILIKINNHLNIKSDLKTNFKNTIKEKDNKIMIKGDSENLKWVETDNQNN